MLRTLAALGLSCLLLTGCITDPQKRLQELERAEKERDLNLRIVSDVADFGNDGPLKVHGVGLVVGLAGTGHSPEGEYRKLMEQFLLKNLGPRDGQMKNVPKDMSVRQILDSPNNCLVIVSGYLPPGARKGDRFDLDIELPYGSKASSLAGGQLLHCNLRVFEAISKISSNSAYQNSRQMLGGHVFADAKGPLVVAFGGNADVHELKRGKVWQGGASRIARPYQLMMRNDEKSHRIANDVAQRINFMYQDDPRAKKLHADYSTEESHLLLEGLVANQLNQTHDPSGMGVNEAAKAMSKEIINVRMPFAYRFNHERFLIVSGFTPINTYDPNLLRYRQRLQKMLLDPFDAMAAAMRIEALGRDVGIPMLKPGLESNHPYVRFASAEALAYLGSTAGVDALTQAAREHPVFVKHAALALANLGESICRDRLAELMITDQPALRCAAFHALSMLDENDSRLGGTFLNGTAWVHRVPQAPNSEIYFSTGRRPQIVLFGKGITLAPGTRMMVGNDFPVIPGERAGEFLVKRITVQGEERRVSTNRVDDILTCLIELRATYPDLVDFLRKANDHRYVNCPVAVWSLPETTLETLIVTGRQMRSGL
ncbi:MAG: flagellar basal body P-ring protein FlgI [Planctomycetes bacterium]|nr:flagellar basal body P-ring protein FlgI [Planctomycetota bacterium]